jgi:hypothetical protein
MYKFPVQFFRHDEWMERLEGLGGQEGDGKAARRVGGKSA